MREQDLKAIAHMLQLARKHGLEVEVIYAYGIEKESGKPVAQAAQEALEEWDIWTTA